MTVCTTKKEEFVINKVLSKHSISSIIGAVDTFNTIFKECLHDGVDINGMLYGDICDLICSNVMKRTED